MVKLETPIALLANTALTVLEINRKEILKKPNVKVLMVLNEVKDSIKDIQNAVEGYTNPWNIFYRIFNAVKACFGMSDWQCAKKSLLKLKNSTTLIISNLLKLDSTDKKTTSLLSFLMPKSAENKICSSLADAMLETLVQFNRNKDLQCSLNLILNEKLEEKQKEEIEAKLDKNAYFGPDKFASPEKLNELIQFFTEPFLPDR